MIAYYIKYNLKSDIKPREISVDAKDLKSAKNKIGKKHGYKSGRNIVINECHIIGYF